jgi:hypothetical protein
MFQIIKEYPMSFFSFLKRYDNVGVGTKDLGLRRRTTIPVQSVYLGGTGRREWNIRRSLGPVNAPGFMILNSAYVPVPITGDFGLGIAGQFVMQTLAQVKNA